MLAIVLFYLIMLQTKQAVSFVDFFINSNETRTLFGYSGSLYYIYEGDLRLNTQSQVLKINNNKNKIQYSWKSYQKRVSYKVNLNASDHKNLDLSLDIPLVGDVPIDLSSFNLIINCTKLRVNYDSNFKLTIVFNTKKSFDEINLNLSYSKLCQAPSLKTKEEKSNFYIAYLAIIIIVLFIVLSLAGILIRKFRKTESKFNIRYYYKIFRGQKPLLAKTPTMTIKNESIRSMNIIKNSNVVDDDDYGDSMNKNNNYSKLITNVSKLKLQQQQSHHISHHSSNQNIYETLKDLTCVSANLNQTNATTITQANNADLVVTLNAKPMSELRAKKRESRFKVSSNQIKIGDLILEGTFGRIYEGLLTKRASSSNYEEKHNSGGSATDANEVIDEPNVTKVYIKTVSELASTKQADLMVTEASLLKYVKHKHVNSLLGLCVEVDACPLAIFNYCENGNLKNHLRNLKKNELKSSQLTLTIQELLYMTLQLCKAINFIHLKRIVHKDIATRNCWLDKNRFIKLSDSALSRDIFPQDYHCLGDNENRPIMWLSHESLVENKYSMQSDIWSLGVTIWEILSFAKQPYDEIDPFDMETYLLQERNRLEKPNKCPIELHNIYAKCWRLDSELRPTLKELFNSMLEFYSTLGNYV